MEKRQTRRIPSSEVRAAGEGKEKRIEGYFAVFDAIYELWPGATESVARGAFDGALEEDVRCLVDHDSRLVLGRTTAGTLQLRVDEHGLWFSVLINEADTDALNLYARVQRGDVSGCSFGFDILEEEIENRQDGSIHWTLKRVKLYEGSVCTFPAYQDTEAEARKQDYKTIRRRETDAWKTQAKERLQRWH